MFEKNLNEMCFYYDEDYYYDDYDDYYNYDDNYYYDYYDDYSGNDCCNGGGYYGSRSKGAVKAKGTQTPESK